MNLFWVGVLIACLIVYLVMLQKKIKFECWILNLFQNCICSNNGLGGQIQGLNDPTIYECISCNFPILGWNLIPTILKRSRVFFLVKENKWSDNFSSILFVFLFSFWVFLVIKEFIFSLLMPWKLNVSLPLFFYCLLLLLGGGVNPHFIVCY